MARPFLSCKSCDNILSNLKTPIVSLVMPTKSARSGCSIAPRAAKVGSSTRGNILVGSSKFGIAACRLLCARRPLVQNEHRVLKSSSPTTGRAEHYD